MTRISRGLSVSLALALGACQSAPCTDAPPELFGCEHGDCAQLASAAQTAMDELRPQVRCVDRLGFSTGLRGRGREALGRYSPSTRTVEIRAGIADDTLPGVVRHEVCHGAEHATSLARATGDLFSGVDLEFQGLLSRREAVAVYCERGLHALHAMAELDDCHDLVPQRAAAIIDTLAADALRRDPAGPWPSDRLRGGQLDPPVGSQWSTEAQVDRINDDLLQVPVDEPGAETTGVWVDLAANAVGEITSASTERDGVPQTRPTLDLALEGWDAVDAARVGDLDLFAMSWRPPTVTDEPVTGVLVSDDGLLRSGPRCVAPGATVTLFRNRRGLLWLERRPEQLRWEELALIE